MKVIQLQELMEIVNNFREENKKIVFTNGCFDILHEGHLSYLQQARSMGDALIVGLNSDASVRRYKGEGRPVNKQEIRESNLAALEYVDYVIVFEEDTPMKLLEAIRPNVLVKGGDYSLDGVVGRDFVESYGGVVRVTDKVEGVSTTKIIESRKSGK